MFNLKNLIVDFLELTNRQMTLSLLSILLKLIMLQFLLVGFLSLLLYFSLLMLKCLTRILARYQLPHLRQHSTNEPKPVLVGFFHPYCNAGGGGERVLWSSIKALQQRYDHVRCVVYTGDLDVSRDEILKKVKDQFNIDLPRTDPISLSFCLLHSRKLVEASNYKIMTMLGQSTGSVLLGLEALFKFIPDVYIDSMGYAFTLPLFKYLAGCRVACYVHYPTISSDMLQVVSNREHAHNNEQFVSRSRFMSLCKFIYYKIFAFVYGFVGRFSDVVMVNSTWTKNHIMDIWKIQPTIVYPPCNVEEFLKIGRDAGVGDGFLKLKINKNGEGEVDDDNTKYIVSIAQFRPEKDHSLQLKSFKRFLKSVETEEDECKKNELKKNIYKLVLIGSCRNEEDMQRVDRLKNLAEELEITSSVDFKVNISFADMKEFLKKASVGLHTMWNEHFGIGIVECMAAGVVMLAHDSGGPKMDILADFEGQQTGFLASDEVTYAEKLVEIFTSPEEQLLEIKRNAKLSIMRFSDECYHANFLNATDELLGD